MPPLDKRDKQASTCPYAATAYGDTFTRHAVSHYQIRTVAYVIRCAVVHALISLVREVGEVARVRVQAMLVLPGLEASVEATTLTRSRHHLKHGFSQVGVGSVRQEGTVQLWRYPGTSTQMATSGPSGERQSRTAKRTHGVSLRLIPVDSVLNPRKCSMFVFLIQRENLKLSGLSHLVLVKIWNFLFDASWRAEPSTYVGTPQEAT